MSEDLISAFDIRGTEKTGLDVEYAWNIGKALADWLPMTGNVVVVALPNKKHLAEAVVEGLRLQGRNVVDGGSGDSDAAIAYIKTSGLAGGVAIGYDEMERVTTIALYQANGQLITTETGLKDIHQLVQAGNFVPAAVKGELTAIA